MGCDIHTFIEKRNKGTWEYIKDGVIPITSSFSVEYDKKIVTNEPFDWRSYGMFGFLADVRNYSECPVICSPKGFPEDASKEVLEEYNIRYGDAHSASWLTVKELADYDYHQVFWDRRIMKNNNGASKAEEGEGEYLSMRQFLGDNFFANLEALKLLGNPEEVRVVFWFDN